MKMKAVPRVWSRDSLRKTKRFVSRSRVKRRVTAKAG